MRVHLLKLFWIVVGIGLLVVVAAQVDVADAFRQAVKVGWGIAALFGLYLLSFVCDVVAWKVTIPSMPSSAGWLYRLWKVRMAGEALNMVIPAAGLGGEPLKAVLLKRHYGIDYREGVASLILSQSMIVVSLVLFLVGGFALMMWSPTLPKSIETAASIGLAAIVVGAAVIVALQTLKPTTLFGARIARLAIGRKVEETLANVRDVEERLATFYTRRPRQFVAALAFSFIPWLIGIPEIYYAAYFLGQPISLVDAWIVEAAVQTVRTGLAFVPAAIGAQEGAYLLIVSALTGSPTLGVSLALLRRFRELVWVAWGAGVGLTFYGRAQTNENP